MKKKVVIPLDGIFYFVLVGVTVLAVILAFVVIPLDGIFYFVPYAKEMNDYETYMRS